MARFATSGFLAPPHFFLLLLVVANATMFLLCLRAGGSAQIPADVLVANGALVPWALDRGEYWRLIAAGFLHANPAHVIMNMISLVILGPHLERRLGASYFVLIYFVSLIGSSVASIGLHPGAYLGVGASGAIYGVFAALFALWILGEINLPASFFVINFALNIVFATRTPHIDWAAHFGGFCGGFIACTVLVDLVEKRNLLGLRCKFPEFVKFDALALIAVLVVSVSFAPPPALADVNRWLPPAIGLCGAYALLRLLDLLLSQPKGLAAAVMLLAVANAAAAFLLLRFASAGSSLRTEGGALTALREQFCSHVEAVSVGAAFAALFLTAALGAKDFQRGLGDKGFVAQGLRAERRRRA